jgi:hypothetical protein
VYDVNVADEYMLIPFSSMLQWLRLSRHGKLRESTSRMPMSPSVSESRYIREKKDPTPTLILFHREDFKCLLPTDPSLGSHANKEPFVCVRGTTNGKTARQECERIQKLAGPI